MKKKKARAKKSRPTAALLELIKSLKGSLKTTKGPSGLDILLEERKREFEHEEEKLRRWGKP